MYFAIVSRELADHLTSLRFAAVFVLAQALMVTPAVVFTAEFQTAAQDYPDRVEGLVDEGGLTNLQNVPCDGGYTVRRAPARLAFAAGTGARELPNEVGFAIHGLKWVSRSGDAADAIAGGIRVDWVYAIGVLLSFAAGVLTYRSVAGELESGTLALTLTNPVSRATVLLGKYTAAVLALGASLAVGMVLGVLVIQLQGVVQFRGDDWIRLGAVGALALLYISCFVLIGLLCSVLTRSSSIAAMAFLFAWAVLVFAVPNVVGVLAPRISTAPSPLEIRHRADSIGDRIPTTPGMDAFRVASTRVEQQLAEEDVLLEYVQELEGQVRSGQNLARLSPTAAFTYAAEEVSGSGLGRFRRFLDNAVRYRQQVFDAILAADGQDEESQHRYQPWSCGSNSFSRREVDLGPAKAFRDPPPSGGAALRTASLDIILLLAYNAALFLATFTLFMRQDVTRGSAL